MTLIAAGDVPTADQLNNQILVAKAAAQIVNNSTTFVNDAELTAAVSANTTYAFQVSLIFTSNTTPDIKATFTFPSLATCAWGSVRLVTTASPTGDADFGSYSSATSGSSAVGAAGTGGVQIALISGTLFVGATAGSLTLQWAQLVANATDTTVHAGSWMLLTRS